MSTSTEESLIELDYIEKLCLDGKISDEAAERLRSNRITKENIVMLTDQEVVELSPKISDRIALRQVILQAKQENLGLATPAVKVCKYDLILLPLELHH